jgi:hypothetical protein
LFYTRGELPPVPIPIEEDRRVSREFG